MTTTFTLKRPKFTSSDQPSFQFIEEEDPDEVAKVKSVAQGRMMMVDIGYDSDSDSDEELLYTTESSSDSNESSDDPNYGSTKRDGLWNRRSNKAKKRKMKKMKKLKMLSRQVKIKPWLSCPSYIGWLREN